MTHGSPAVSTVQSEQSIAEDSFRQDKSKKILRYMNESLDPCEDFYEFTCGNYANYNGPRVDLHSPMSSLATSSFVFYAKHKIELEANDESDTEADKRVKSFYKSCLNRSATAHTKEQWLVFLRAKGQMPVLEDKNWQESKFDWMTAIADIYHRTSLSLILGINVISDFADNSINRVHISESGFIDKRSRFYIHREYAEHRQMQINNIEFVLRHSLYIESKLAKQTAEEIIDFEIAVAQGIADTNQLSHYAVDTSPLTTADEMQRRYLPEFDYQKLLSRALEFIPSELYVQHQYVENALNVIRKTPKRIVANYIYFNYFAIFPFQYQSDSEVNRELCVRESYGHFYVNMDNKFYRKHISPEVEQPIYHMWQEIKSIFQSVLQSPSLAWMQEDTRKQALQKLNDMRLIIPAYDDTHLQEDLAQLEISDHDYINNMVLLLALKANRTRASIHTASNISVWSSYSPRYSRSDNAIIISALTVQQYYLYSSSYPNAYNYATLGFVLGHEMQHGFDAARRYDAQGNIRNWWDTQSDEEYLERTKCFINQYKQYKFGQQLLPEMKYQAENIADIGGLRTAYAAYLKWYKNAEAANQSLELETMSGLNYTPKQLFFISYSHWWCRKFESNYVTMKVAAHVPPKFRVIGPLSNFNEFSQAFHCPTGGGMNPARKCKMY